MKTFPVQMNLFTKQKCTHRHRKQTSGYMSTDGWGSLHLGGVPKAFPPCWLFVMSCSNTGACWLCSQCENGNLWESSCQWIFPSTSAISVLDPTVSHSPTSPGDPPRLLGRPGPGSYGVTTIPWLAVHLKSYGCPPRVESLFRPVLWSSCA